MTVLNNIRWGAAIGAGILFMATWAARANAELVYEDTPTAPAEAPVSNRAEERSTLRQAVNASEKAQSTLQSQSPQAPMTAPVQQPFAHSSGTSSPSNVVYVNSQTQSTAAQSLDSTEVQNMSRSELLRRERVRAEIKNEDLLQERLEELRLRDEQKRSEQLVGGAPIAPAAPQQSVAPVFSQPLQLQEEAVVVPSTERPGQGSRQVAVPAANQGTQSSVQQDQLYYSASSAMASSVFTDNSERTQLSVQPRFGLAQMNGTAYYDVRPRFASGVALGVVSSENVSFELGYTYSEFGVAMNSYNPYTPLAQTAETVVMKQNMVDLGLKLHLLGTDAKIRPFVGGGAGYAFSYVNYDQRYLDQMAGGNAYWRNYLGQDYELKSFLGFVSTGVDVRVSRNVVLGAVAKYFNVFSSRESSALNNAALWGYPGYGTAPDADKQYIGGTLARLNFYSVMGSVTFTF